MKTLSDFKRRLKVGEKLHTFNNLMGKDMGIRELSIVKSNSFAFRTQKYDGKIVDSWCFYPSAKNFVVVDDNTVQILEENDNIKFPILTYKFV